MGKSHLEHPPTGASPRRLSVIYFVDASRTRALSLSLRTLRLIFLVLAGVISWSLASIYVIILYQREQNRLDQKLENALQAVFEYQARYEGVYETAYPPIANVVDTTSDPLPPGVRVEDHAEITQTTRMESPAESDSPTTQSQGSEASQGAQASSAAPSSPAAPGDSSWSTAAGQPSLVQESGSSGEKSTEDRAGSEGIDAWDGASGGTWVLVNNSKVETSDQGLAVQFDLVNHSDAARAEGYIWAVAEFVGQDGKKIFVGAPKEVKVNAKGEPENPSRSIYFGIKRFKRQFFKFALPKGRAGPVRLVRVGVMDLNGERRKVYRIPIEAKPGQKS